VWLEESPVVRKSIETGAYPEQIWEALTDTDLLGHWMADKATGWPAVGGTLALTWERFGLTIDYKVAEVKTCQKLVWKTPMGNGQQTITFELRRQGRSTWVDVTDAPPPFTPANPHSSADSTWAMSLAILKLYVEKYYRKSRHNFMAVARASFTFPEVVAAYATAPGLKQWLAESIEVWPSTARSILCATPKAKSCRAKSWPSPSTKPASAGTKSTASWNSSPFRWVRATRCSAFGGQATASARKRPSKPRKNSSPASWPWPITSTPSRLPYLRFNIAFNTPNKALMSLGPNLRRDITLITPRILR